MSPGTLIQYLGFIQLQVTTGQIEPNLRRLRHMLAQLNPPKLSLLILPELWGTGFAYREMPRLQHEISHIYEELQELAARYDILLAGTLPEQSTVKENLFFNTLKIVGGSDTFGKYRKQQIFPGEELAFCGSSAVSPPIVTPLGTFGCMICFDLRFPDIARHQCQQGADLLICPAQWPLARIHHWRTLVTARAIENQTYIVACNGVGKNGEHTLGGHSRIVSPVGAVLHEAGENESAAVIELDWQVKKDAQSQFKSFAASPYQSSARKIVPPEFSVEEAERRTMNGQRVVFFALTRDLPFSRALDQLEAARQHGDYLIVGIRLATQSDDTLFPDGKQLLQCYAALGCVDAVFDLDGLQPSSEQRLRNICRTLLAEN